MEVIDRVAQGITILVEIFVVCLPVFFVLLFLEKFFDRVNDKVMSFDMQAWFDSKLEKEKTKERAVWDKRAHDIDERDAHEHNADSNA